MYKKLILSLGILVSITSQAQTLGGGTLFSNAVTFDQAWITGCPGGGTPFSNQAAFEPTTTMDPCVPDPSIACVSGTTGSDVWFSFFAQSATASIVVAPSSSFDVAIQAFSGTACPGITQIGCIDAGGNNVSETLNLTGLVPSTRYYFRIFGATSSGANRTGTYAFCGSTGLGSSSVLPVEIISFNAVKQSNNVLLSWTTGSESNNSYFEIERSSNGAQYEPIGRVEGMGTTVQKNHYNFTDLRPLAGTNYYRLKQVDKDGKAKYSAILIFKGDKNNSNSINIYPNPVVDKININVSSDVATNGLISIFNETGIKVYEQNKLIIKGQNIFTLNAIPNLSKGVYFVKVAMNSKIFTTKFMQAK